MAAKKDLSEFTSPCLLEEARRILPFGNIFIDLKPLLDPDMLKPVSIAVLPFTPKLESGVTIFCV
jgi:hypothetical protein